MYGQAKKKNQVSFMINICLAFNIYYLIFFNDIRHYLSL